LNIMLPGISFGPAPMWAALLAAEEACAASVPHLRRFERLRRFAVLAAATNQRADLHGENLRSDGPIHMGTR